MSTIVGVGTETAPSAVAVSARRLAEQLWAHTAAVPAAAASCTILVLSITETSRLPSETPFTVQDLRRAWSVEAGAQPCRARALASATDRGSMSVKRDTRILAYCVHVPGEWRIARYDTPRGGPRRTARARRRCVSVWYS